MLITRKSILTDKVNEREIDVTPEQLNAWQHGDKPIQKMLPHLSVDDREFLMNGCTPEEWEEEFG